MTRRSDFEHQWFSKPPVPSWPAPSIPPPPPIGAPSWAAGLGAISGSIGGFLAIIVDQIILDIRHVDVDVIRKFGGFVTPAGVTLPDPQIAGLLAAIAIGAVLGAPLGYLSRRLLRIAPRVIFFSLLLPAIWIFVQAFVLRKLGGGLAAELPFGPLVAGSLVYGVCVAGVVPIRAPA